MDEKSNHIRPKQMSYKYWLVGMISQGLSNSEHTSEEFADIVVDRAEAVLERLREDKRKRRDSEEYE